MLTIKALDQCRALFEQKFGGNVTDALKKEFVRFCERSNDELLAKIRQNPIYQQYIRYHSPEPNTQPWHAIGEQYNATVCMALCSKIPEVTSNAQGIHINAIASFAYHAQPYLWRESIEDLVRSSPPLPTHTLSSNLLPYPIMFFSRERAHKLVLEDDSRTLWTNWMLLFHNGDHIGVITDASNFCGEKKEDRAEDPKTELVYGVIPYGKCWPHDFEGRAFKPAIEQVLKQLSFLASPFIDPNPQRLLRPQRREMERHGVEKKEQEKTVNVVILRQKLVDPRNQSEESEIGREYHHHWWVTGHHRAQYYPSEKAHKVIWIGPHIKGDRSKPLLQKVYTVER